MSSAIATIVIMTFFGTILVGWGMIVQAAMANALQQASQKTSQQRRQPWASRR